MHRKAACEGNALVTGGFPSQKTSSTERVYMSFYISMIDNNGINQTMMKIGYRSIRKNDKITIVNLFLSIQLSMWGFVALLIDEMQTFVSRRFSR